jgi:tetratricopeptide (TPR) repeat protein
MNSLKANSKYLRKSTIAFLFKACLILLVVAGVQSCNTSKSLSKKGAKLEEAGLYNDAALFYYNALLKNSSNIDARIGLSKAGQRVLNDKIDDFTRSRAMEEYRDAVYAYKDAMDYRTKVEKLGIKLEAPSYLADDYEEAKNILIKGLYDEGNKHLVNKDFDKANKIFEEIHRLDPDYKDIDNLKDVSRNEPIYIAAVDHFDQGRYRKAFYEFEKIYKVNPSYKDIGILREECLDKGKYPVAIAPFENSSGNKGIEKKIQAFVITELSGLNDPFLRIVERDNMEMVMEEQRLSLSGIVDESTAAEVGNILGAKAILTGKVLAYSSNEGKLQSSRKKAFEGYQVKLYNKLEDKVYYETRYKPVSYTEYYNLNEVDLTFQFKAVSLETGEILFSDVVQKKENSEVHYASYDGEATNLYPSKDNRVVTSSRDRRQLINLVRSNREIKTVSQLSNDAYREAAQAVASDLYKFMKDI